MGIIFANEKTIDKMRTFEAITSHLLFQMPINTEVDARVADHTDLSLFIYDAVYIAPCIYNAFLEKMATLRDADAEDVRIDFLADRLVCGMKSQKKEYPYNIAYNAVKLKDYFFHKLEHTEPKILESINCDRIDVKQGYTRCATMVITEQAVITEDVGLAQRYKDYGFDVLVIDKGHIVLPGYNYGFFGGTGGVIEDLFVINGALKHHPDGDAIKTFVHRHGLQTLELHDGPLIDCGSILYLNIK